MSFFCKHCSAEINAPYEWGGISIGCPSCARVEPLQYRTGQRIANSASGYGLSFSDFASLLDSEEAQPMICGMLSCSVEKRGSGFVIVSEGGALVPSEYAHLQIQANSSDQRRLYNLAMSLWR